MYIYYNVNPEGDHIGDCVIRAISLALNINYDKVITLLNEISNQFNCDMLVRDCYGKLLTEGLNLPMIEATDKTVEEVAEDFKNNILLVRTPGHLTCIKYGDIYDIWDCSEELVDIFWLVR